MPSIPGYTSTSPGGYPYSLGSYWHDDYRCNHRLHEARTWAIRMKQERDTANHRLDECAESLRNVYGLLADAERENNELVTALKKLWEVSHGYYLQEWMDIIDAALDGVEVDGELINSTWGKYNSTTPLTTGLIDERKAEENPWKDCDCLNCKPRNQQWARDALAKME